MAAVYNVSISSDFNEFPVEKRYDVLIKISELKKKLELITGANHTTMKIFLSVDDKDIGELANDDQTLVSYVGDQVSKESVLKLVVKDDHSTNVLDGDVPKFTLSDEKYVERQNNARNFIKEVREKQSTN